jgi:hypothetical protein
MAKNKYTINGRLLDHLTLRGIEGLVVKAWDNKLIYKDVIGSATTDTDGFFTLEFEKDLIERIFTGRSTDLQFRIYHEDELIPSASFVIEGKLPSGEAFKLTGTCILRDLEPGETQCTIRLDFAAKFQDYKVHGRILKPDGTPIGGAVVKVYDKDLSEITLLGEAITGKTGNYEIAYPADKFLAKKKNRPDLIVRAFDKQVKEIASSVIIFNAKEVETVDLIEGGAKYKGPSEYTRLVETLTPLLKGVELGDLTDEDIDFLSQKTGVERIQIVSLSEAAKLSMQTNVTIEAL